MNKYYKYKMKNILKIKNILTIEYLELYPKFSYEIESHSFWEMVYVDSGTINCFIEDLDFKISHGELFFIKPDSKHYYHVAGKIAPSIFIICFNCDSTIIKLLGERITLAEKHINIFKNIIKETKGTFEMPFKNKLSLIQNPNLGGQQLIVGYLEELLILLLREQLNQKQEIILFTTNIELENHLIKDLSTLLKNSIFGNITIEEVCSKLNYSKTYINSICKKHLNYPIMHYYRLLKINEAKKLIRSNKYNFTEISNMLQFDNPNYFTKVFKKLTNKTPSEYRKSIFL